MNFATMFVCGFLTTHEGIPIHKVFADQSQIDTMLRTELIDLAITYPPVRGPEVASRLISREEVVLAVSEKHPLATKPHITLKDLSRHEFVCLTRANPFRRLCDMLMQERGVVRKYKEYDYLDYTKRIETERGGTAFLSFTTRGTFQKWYGKGYILRSVEDGGLVQETAVSWRTDSDIQYRHEDLLDQIVNEYLEAYENTENRQIVIRDFG